MDIYTLLGNSTGAIKTVDMHTSGEPTRIITEGYPKLEGDTLLMKRQCARTHYDHIRKRIMLEPRGHAEMYGAILVQETELTATDEADIGVLFCHNEGYSTMCGHATLALGRFLVDTHDLSVFPKRKELKYDGDSRTLRLRLHAPCGLVLVSVPVVRGTDGKTMVYDSSRRVTFLSVPSYVTAPSLVVQIPAEKRWRQSPTAVTVDVAYGGAFYGVISAKEAGFANGLTGAGLKDLDEMTAALKSCIEEQHAWTFSHTREKDLGFLYGIMVVDKDGGRDGEQLGVCFFADQQVDRSPTGSCVSAQVALAMRNGELEMGQEQTYHSLVSIHHDGNGFTGRAVKEVEGAYTVEVSGRAFYTGACSFVFEEGDGLKDGFVFSY